MANATVAVNSGFEFQARFFWFLACRLFKDRTKVAQVGYELGEIRYFDDAVIRYNRPMHDRYIEGYQAEYYQIKYHVDSSGALTYQALMDPDFINSKKTSFLQRLATAHQMYSPTGQEALFSLVTNWAIDPKDPLAKLVSQQEGEFRLELLFGEKASPEMRAVRESWLTHLQLSSDKELCRILQAFRINSGTGPMSWIQKDLNQALEQAGLKPVEEGTISNPYDDLIKKLRAEGKMWFGREDIEEICKREHLWVGRPSVEAPEVVQLGIRSFSRFAEKMEDETSDMLCLMRHFQGRKPHSPELWVTCIYPEVDGFIRRAIVPGPNYLLRLDTHGAIAFTAGYCLGPKSGIEVAIHQPNIAGNPVWRLNPATLQSADPEWNTQIIPINPGRGKDVGLAISITHDICSEVQEYTLHKLSSVGKIIHFTVLPAPGGASVRDASHAYRLVQELTGWIRQHLSLDERRATFHIFAAAPNFFQFYLGRQASSMGACIVYEYPLGEPSPEYAPAIMVPPRPLHATISAEALTNLPNLERTLE